MYRKVGVLLLAFIILSGIFTIGIPAAELDTSKLDEKLEDLKKAEQAARDAKEDLTELNEEKQWEYISARWKGYLLKKAPVIVADGFLKKINIVFVIFLGQDYSLSFFDFFLVVFLWFFFLFYLTRIIGDFSTFSKWVALAMGFALTIISAQLGVLRGISTIIFKVLFFKSGIWPWVSFFGMIVLFFVLVAVMKVEHAMSKARKIARRRSRTRGDQDILHIQAAAFKKIWGEPRKISNWYIAGLFGSLILFGVALAVEVIPNWVGGIFAIIAAWIGFVIGERLLFNHGGR